MRLLSRYAVPGLVALTSFAIFGARTYAASDLTDISVVKASSTIDFPSYFGCAVFVNRPLTEVGVVNASSEKRLAQNNFLPQIDGIAELGRDVSYDYGLATEVGVSLSQKLFDLEALRSVDAESANVAASEQDSAFQLYNLAQDWIEHFYGYSENLENQVLQNQQKTRVTKEIQVMQELAQARQIDSADLLLVNARLLKIQNTLESLQLAALRSPAGNKNRSGSRRNSRTFVRCGSHSEPNGLRRRDRTFCGSSGPQ